MNPSGKCIECQNPWGSLTSCADDEHMGTDMEIPTQGREMEEEESEPRVLEESWQVGNSCPLSLGMGFFEALENRGMVRVDACEDMFLVKCVIDQLLRLVSHELRRPKETLVAVHAFTLGSEGLCLSLCFDSMLVLRDDECFVLNAQDDPECYLRYSKVIVAYTKDSFMPFLKHNPSRGCGGSIAWFREKLCGNCGTARSRKESRVFAQGGARGASPGRARQI